MIRLAIIDHEKHCLYVEDVEESVIEEKYGGEEEAYIRDTYDLGEMWSWDFILMTDYFPSEGDYITVHFEDLVYAQL